LLVLRGDASVWADDLNSAVAGGHSVFGLKKALKIWEMGYFCLHVE
jgi:hypothetical protein